MKPADFVLIGMIALGAEVVLAGEIDPAHRPAHGAAAVAAAPAANAQHKAHHRRHHRKPAPQP